MSILQIIGIILMVIGIISILYALIVFSKDKPTNENDYLERNILTSIGSRTNDIDKTIDEFDKTSSEVLTQLDDKYNELLFPYSLIDDKKTEMAGLYGNAPQISQKLSELAVLSDGGKRFKSPRHDEIRKLTEQGLSVADIAKSLNIGQGEVRLIIELGKISAE